jgi:hypothetical protein
MKYLAVDASTSCVGWCVGEDDKYLVSGYVVPTGDDAWARADWSSFWLAALLAVHKPDVFCYEYPSGNRNNMDTNLKLGHMMGTCLNVVRMHFLIEGNIEKSDRVIIIRPTQVKKTGVHKNDFSLVYQLTQKKFEWKTKVEKSRLGDEADAIGVWLAARAL